VAGGDAFAGFGVLHILDAILTQNNTPVGFCFGIVLLENFFVKLLGFVEFAFDAQTIGSVKQILDIVTIDILKMSKCEEIAILSHTHLYWLPHLHHFLQSMHLVTFPVK
jgi:hypothetical protein